MNNVNLKNQLTKEKVEEVANIVNGLTKSQWDILKVAIDYVYNQKAAKVKFDSNNEKQIVVRILTL